jgi:hypothetical protein
VNSQPSALPPDPKPTLETLGGRLDHLITVVELMSARVESMDDSWEGRVSRLTERERALSSLASRLASAALSMSGARLMPRARWLVATSVGAFAGGVVGSMVWQWAHAAAALAAP